MKREANEILVILTGWIIMAFLTFVLQWEPAKMGAACRSPEIGLLQGFPLQNFSPTSENLFLFLSYILYPFYFPPRPRTSSPHRPAYFPTSHRPRLQTAPPISPYRTARVPSRHRLRPHSVPGIRLPAPVPRASSTLEPKESTEKA